MNQYERIVSYIYQYHQDEKGANVGYAKVEKRGNQCRISVQMRAAAMNEMPGVYLYKQKEEGIETISAGKMVFRGNSMLWKESSEADRLFGTDWSIEDVDGIFIYGTAALYFATSWKNDRFYRGNWGKESTNVERVAEKQETANQQETAVEGKKERKEEIPALESADIKPGKENLESADIKTVKEEIENKSVEEMPSKEEADSEEALEPSGETSADTSEKEELQMQSICGVCPFKRKTYDYGKKILLTFPSMKPFEDGVARACVRMELQDIGCLPIASWSLSGNRFLLHGYYCYRHLLFAQLADGRYVLGVPGIYSEKERRNAVRFGFTDFKSIGDFGMQQGVFGYWFLELPEGNPTNLS